MVGPGRHFASLRHCKEIQCILFIGRCLISVFSASEVNSLHAVAIIALAEMESKVGSNKSGGGAKSSLLLSSFSSHSGANHRRTRRGSGGQPPPPSLKIFRANSVFRASASCSKIVNVKSIFNAVKNSRATLFSGQAQVVQKF